MQWLHSSCWNYILEIQRFFPIGEKAVKNILGDEQKDSQMLPCVPLSQLKKTSAYNVQPGQSESSVRPSTNFTSPISLTF